MATSGAQPGNNNAAKAKIITDRLRKACVQEEFKRVDQGIDVLLNAMAAGEQWAIEQVINRFEGKPAQGVIHAGDDEGGPIRAKVSVEFVNHKDT